MLASSRCRMTRYARSWPGSTPLYGTSAATFEQGKYGGDPLKLMGMVARQMTDEQVRAVGLYFASLRPPEMIPEDRFFMQPPAFPPPVSGEPASLATDMDAVVHLETGRGGVVVPDAQSVKQPQRGQDATQ